MIKVFIFTAKIKNNYIIDRSTAGQFWQFSFRVIKTNLSCSCNWKILKSILNYFPHFFLDSYCQLFSDLTKKRYTACMYIPKKLFKIKS
jgi:hypothetical protein